MLQDGAASADLRASYVERVVDASRSVTAVIGLDGVVHYASAGLTDLLGVPPAAAVGVSVLDWLHPDEVDRVVQSLLFSEEVGGAIRYFPMTFRLRHADGHHVELDVLAANHVDDPAIAGIVVNLRRADERSQYEEPVRAIASGASHRHVLRLIASGVGRGGEALRPAIIASQRDPASGHFGRLDAVRASDGLVAAVQDALDRGRLVAWSALHPRQLQALPCEDLPVGLADHLQANGFAGVRLGAVGVSGLVQAVLVSAEPTEIWQGGRWSPSMTEHWEQLLDLAAVAFERRRHQVRLVHAATHDDLTGLANRTRFFERLGRMASRDEVAVLYIDLDGFKAVNDRFGHACGDEVLVEVAHRLHDAVRPGDLVARLGGDEFAIAVAGREAGLASDLAERVAAAVTAPLPDGSRVARIGVSIGVSHRGPGQSLDDLVNCADRALLSAKRQGRGRVIVA